MAVIRAQAEASNLIEDEVSIVIQGNQMPARLYALSLKDYDVILGMDWLEAYRVIVMQHIDRSDRGSVVVEAGVWPLNVSYRGVAF
ncbi:hypothetical protein Taro_043311 [Colocasia esculenta]|uniref:Uncharacterized protein n=1 Tax=Colocasia esculenta TaxID=4460 RepID=A0A843WKR8_COLES|nr:hypothetical protein [Colocasia esculenta]